MVKGVFLFHTYSLESTYLIPQGIESHASDLIAEEGVSLLNHERNYDMNLSGMVLDMCVHDD